MLLHRFAIGLAVATYLLIMIGGLVHGTGSSLACPDWPLCYGSLLPKMEGGVAVEHSHRLAAGTVAVATLLLAVMLQRSATPALRRLRPWGWTAVGLVIVQAVLGGITVLLRLPTPISTAHTATSVLFFVTVLYVAVRSRPRPAAAAPPAALPGGPVRVALVAAVAIYFQMALGGLVRHSGAALACLDFPLCRGAVWPDAHPTVLVHVVHRLGAVVVAALVLASAVATLRGARARGDLRALAAGALGLVAMQIALGVRAVLTFLDLATVEAHLGVATALLATQILIVLLGRPAGVPAPWRASWLRDLVQLGKPRVTGLVVLTFAGGLWLAPGSVPGWRVWMTVVGTALIVAASNAFNMFLERDADRLMARTCDRPLPAGRLSPETALAFGTALACAAMPLLLLGGNLLTGLLGLGALASYVWIYTPLKRRSAAALFVGAVPGALPPLMGWTAATGRLEAPALALFAVLFLWQIPHFLAIALYRSADYRRAGIRVLPLVVPARVTSAVIATSSLALAASTILLEPLGVAGMRYLVAAGVLGAVFVGFGLAGLRRVAAAAWARSLFWFSIVYLVLLFAALAFDRVSRTLA
jgi:protoheme IX farnesyltransferase